VYTGILPLCKDEQGLAAVLGHEIAHALLHHHAERLSSEFIALPIVVAASIIFGVSAQLPSLVLDLVYKLPHSRTHEVG
jgi:Zn-dependent protease with chaperone function